MIFDNDKGGITSRRTKPKVFFSWLRPIARALDKLNSTVSLTQYTVMQNYTAPVAYHLKLHITTPIARRPQHKLYTTQSNKSVQHMQISILTARIIRKPMRHYMFFMSNAFAPYDIRINRRTGST